MILRESGSFLLRSKHKNSAFTRTVVYVSGTFDTANVYFAYYDSFNNAIPLLNGNLEAGKQYILHDGNFMNVSVIVENASANTQIDVQAYGIS